jgi:hypothetical protein
MHGKSFVAGIALPLLFAAGALVGRVTAQTAQAQPAPQAAVRWEFTCAWGTLDQAAKSVRELTRQGWEPVTATQTLDIHTFCLKRSARGGAGSADWGRMP